MHQLNLINSLTKWAQTFDSKLKKILSADLAGDILKSEVMRLDNQEAS